MLRVWIQCELPDFGKRLLQFAMCNQLQQKPLQLAVGRIPCEQLFHIGGKILIRKPPDGAVVCRRIANRIDVHGLTDLVQHFLPNRKWKRLGFTSLERQFRGNRQGAVANAIVEQDEPNQYRTHGRHDNLFPILFPEEHRFDPAARGLASQKLLEPFSRQELPDGAMIKSHRLIDGFVENRPGQQCSAFRVIPVG